MTNRLLQFAVILTGMIISTHVIADSDPVEDCDYKLELDKEGVVWADGRAFRLCRNAARHGKRWRREPGRALPDTPTCNEFGSSICHTNKKKVV